MLEVTVSGADALFQRHHGGERSILNVRPHDDEVVASRSRRLDGRVLSEQR
ncbi:hypothetical protein AB0J40_38005 [Amycolatopsis sp. NPDC049691]|uniref:hypothetical protein n=1 Tax=Amycolatopsis sp. NPDC049691 TaxID=3155155 RepID=UPI0034301BA3